MKKPNEINNLILWLKADDITVSEGSPIATWQGAGGTKVNAVQKGVGPVLVSREGNNYVHFDNNQGNQRLDLTTNNFNNNNPLTIMMVVKPESDGHLVGISTSSAPYYPYLKGLTIQGGKYATSARNNSDGALVETGSTDYHNELEIVTSVFSNKNTMIKSSKEERYDKVNSIKFYGYPKATIGASDGSNRGDFVEPFSGYIGEIIIFDRVLTSQEEEDVRKYLKSKYIQKELTFILHDGIYKTYDVTNKKWIEKFPEQPTAEQFQNDGMDDLTVIDEAALRQLNGPFKVVKWLDEISYPPITQITNIPENQLVIPKGDINIAHAERLNYFRLNTNAIGNGKIKVVVSFDKGVTWLAFDGIDWKEVDFNTESVGIDGMNISRFNNISSQDWENARNKSKTVRFAYFFSMENITDEAAVDELLSEIDMKGVWRKAVHGTDYDYGYADNEMLSIELFKDGDYKINY